MADILLVTANARYSHTSLALRCLAANLGDLRSRAEILELTLDDRPADIAERILAHRPRLVLASVYVWNVALLADALGLLKRVAPDTVVVIGGPEVSFGTDGAGIMRSADHVVEGEGEIACRELCAALLGAGPPPPRVVAGRRADPADLALPYDLYGPEDIAHRVVYVEASRGCAHGCEFCLAALDRHVRRFPEDRLLGALADLWRRGARRFKFVDRALHLGITPRLLDFFLERIEPGLFLHFELVPDHLPEPLFERIARFPAGAVQLEAGVQTLNEEVAARVGRRQSGVRALESIRRLRAETGAHIHADLLLGLPGETAASFGDGLDLLFAARPHEIQIGILKRLPGAAIARHDAEWGMVYSGRPPYEVLATRHIDFPLMQRLKRLARCFDLVHNSGNFPSAVELIAAEGSAYQRFLALADALHAALGRSHGIARDRLAELLFDFLVDERGLPPSTAADALAADSARFDRKGAPSRLPKRQRRHHA